MRRIAKLGPVLLTLIAFFLVPIASGQQTAPAAPAQQAGPAALDPNRFNATWRYASSAERGRAIIERAVVRAVDGMNFITQPIATGRLRGKNPLVQRLQINATATAVRVVFDGSRTYQGAPNAWTPHTFDGETLRVQFVVHPDTIVQLFRSDGGSRRNIYRLMPNGTLRLEVTIQSGSLPRNMTYQLDYRR